MKINEYQYAKCGGIFEKGWSDEEALKERDELWEKTNDWAVICDDCFNEIHPEKNLELARSAGYRK